MPLSQSVRGLMRRDVLVLFLVVFIADLVVGMLSPTFSLYAKSLGASLTLVGILSGIAGVTQLFTAAFIGAQSDQRGRKLVLTLGLLFFAAATLVFALAPTPWLLLPGRVFLGLASICTFAIGAAYLGDIIRPEERGVAFGLYTTCMGIGFAIGPLMGTALAQASSLATSYLVGSGLALIGAAVAGLGLRDTRGLRGGIKSVRTGPGWDSMLDRLRDPSLMAASLGNFITSITFTGAVTNFFPVYLSQLGATLPTINAMFSGRAFTSTLARLPTGMLTNRLSSWFVIAAALALAVGSVFMMSQTTSIAMLAFLLVLEGIAFGAFLTAGHAFIAQHSTPMTRGTSVGVYATAGSMGSTFSPILLGIVADVFGVRSVFLVCGVLGAVALLGIVYLYTRRGTTLGPKMASLPEKP